MASLTSIISPTNKSRKPSSVPKILTGLTLKCFTESNSESPTSILDYKPFSIVVGLKNPFGSVPITNLTTPKTPDTKTMYHHQHCWDKLGSKGIVDVLLDEQTEPNLFQTGSRIVLFGSQLKTQISPILPPQSSVISQLGLPESSDFSIKTISSEVGSFSSSGLSASLDKNLLFGTASSGLDTPRISTGCLSASEMEMSEDYTCVISHGSDPKTTHIFDNAIVGFSSSKQEGSAGCYFLGESFLSFCYSCKKNLGQGKDIYMYRGEKAFCSNECRYQEIMLEEGMYSLDYDVTYGTSF